MSRGRLIFPKLLEIARYDTAATEDVGGYDPVLGEPLVTNANRIGQDKRGRAREEKLVLVRGQIETDTFQRLAMGALGNAPGSRMGIVCFAEELEEAGLYEVATGLSLFKPTDRLARILDPETQALLLRIVDPPGLYCTSCKPCGFGFGSGSANLLELIFEGRPPGVGAGS